MIGAVTGVFRVNTRLILNSFQGVLSEVCVFGVLPPSLDN